MARTFDNGIIVATGFKLNDPRPVDDKDIVDTFDDVLTLENAYRGISVKVVDEDYVSYTWVQGAQNVANNWRQTSFGGEANTASNVGSGNGIFAQKSNADLQFKTLVAGDHINITPSSTEIRIGGDGNAETLNSQNAAFYRNASNINTGTLNNARLSTSVVTTTNGGITRQEANPGNPGSTYTINFNSRNEYLTTSTVTIDQATTVAYSNQTNGRLAVIDLQVSGSRVITFPSGSRMQDSESRWNSSNRQLSLPAGRYKMTIKRNSNSDYTMECSDAYI